MEGFPPGLWRRIVIDPQADGVGAALEDDVHRFRLQLIIADGRIAGVETAVERFPWSTCRDAGDHLVSAVVGLSPGELATLDPHDHCTHLIELAIVAAAFADAGAPLRFDLHVSDPVEHEAGEPATIATLARDDIELLRWELRGAIIAAPAAWAGRDLRRFSAWRRGLPERLGLYAGMLRRAVHISGVRRLPANDVERAVDRGPGRLGACYTYQTSRVAAARRSAHPRRDFSATPDMGPLTAPYAGCGSAPGREA